MKIVCITGALGFIGSYITEECLKLGWYVYGIDACLYGSNKKNFIRFKPHKDRFKFIKLDINNLNYLPDCDIFINAAAMTHVDMSISNSKEFIHSNVNGVYSILELMRKTSYSRKLPLLLQIHCYDENTRAITKNGIKSYNEIKIGDEVISINPITKNIEFKKVLNVIIQDYNGEMIHFKHKSDDLMVTPNHRMYYFNKNKHDESIKNTTAEQISENYNCFYPRGKKCGILSNTYFIDGIGNVLIKDLFYLSGIFIGDGFTATQIQKRKNKTGLKRKEYLKLCRNDNNVFKILGHIGNEKYSICICHRIFFDIPKNDKARKKLEQCLTNLNINWHSHKGKAGEHLYFSSKAWSNYFVQFGKYAKNKTIPNWMFDYDYSVLIELYNGLIDSDGCWHENKNKTITGRLSTISYNLVQKSCILGSCLGFHMRYSINKSKLTPSTINGRKIIPKYTSYQIFFNNETIQCGNKKYKKVKYKGKIWCLTVEDNKNFLVERNGLIKFSGNTDEVYSDIKNGNHTENDKLNPSNPYSASKSCGDQLIFAWSRTYNINYVIVRPTNNYGKYQDADTKLIPRTCKYISLGKKIQLHNNGTPIRNWLHAFDTSQAIIKIIESNCKNEIYNISGGYEQSNFITVSKIINCYLKRDINISLTPKEIEQYIDFSYSRKGQDIRYSLDDSKLCALGWNPIKEFDKELPNIVEYYRTNFIW